MFRHVSSLNPSSLLSLSSNSIPKNRARFSTVTNSIHSTHPGSSSERNLLMKGLETRKSDFSHMDSFFTSPLKFDYQPLTLSSDSSPLSLRLTQLRKEKENLPLPKTLPPNLCSVGSSVLSLASLVSETQRVLVHDDSSSCCSTSSSSSCSVESGHSIIWLFRKVFVSSPELTIGILGLMGEFVNLAMKNEIGWIIADLEWEIIMQEKRKDFGSWSEIGVDIQDDSNSATKLNSTEISGQRKQDAYEKLIKESEVSSLILLNYAQFLYQIQKDPNRAEEFFKKAVEAEPIDGEARSQYALFLWEERGDLERAEEMFLEAIEADSGNSHHLATYAHFLWTTGGTDTCVCM